MLISATEISSKFITNSLKESWKPHFRGETNKEIWCLLAVISAEVGRKEDRDIMIQPYLPGWPGSAHPAPPLCLQLWGRAGVTPWTASPPLVGPTPSAASPEGPRPFSLESRVRRLAWRTEHRLSSETAGGACYTLAAFVWGFKVTEKKLMMEWKEVKTRLTWADMTLQKLLTILHSPPQSTAWTLKTSEKAQVAYFRFWGCWYHM